MHNTLEVPDSTLASLRELSHAEQVPIESVLDRAVEHYRKTVLDKSGQLAPDGLPWPPGYFDKTPRITFEDALAKYGVRPPLYSRGWPIYTAAEMTRDEFRSPIASEPQELQDYWNRKRAETVQGSPGPKLE